MMQSSRSRSIRRLLPLPAALPAGFVSGIARASEVPYEPALPVLLGKSWALGYTLVFLGILLGLLAVLIPSMRKPLRKRDVY